jgi:hypothetical protein
MVVKLAKPGLVFYNNRVEYLLYTFFSLPVLISIALIIHCIKTDRDRSWIFIIVFMPVAGALVYFFVEIFPALLRHPRAERTRRSLIRRLTARGRIRRLERELELAPTFANRRRLADEYAAGHRYGEAIFQYAECLSGFDADNQEVTTALALCFLENDEPERALAVLDKLKNAAGLLKKYDIDLLWARALEKTGKTAEAGQAYAAIAPHYPGFEGYVRYGLFLKQNGDPGGARGQFDAVLHLRPTLPRATRQREAHWVNLARFERARLPKQPRTGTERKEHPHTP